MDRSMLLKMWDEFWDAGLFAAPWSKAINVTAAQAAWSPGPGRKSIWQNVNHVVFWREYVVSRARGGANLPPAEVERRNWEPPPAPTEAEWARARERLRRSHDLMRQAIADPATPLERLAYMVPHDSYHLGQVMYLRALQGLAAIE